MDYYLIDESPKSMTFISDSGIKVVEIKKLYKFSIFCKSNNDRILMKVPDDLVFGENDVGTKILLKEVCETFISLGRKDVFKVVGTVYINMTDFIIENKKFCLTF